MRWFEGPPGAGERHWAHDWALAGAVMVLVGAALPFVAVADEAVGRIKPDVIPNVVRGSGVFGAVLVGLAYGMRWPVWRGPCGAVLFVLSFLGLLFFGGFAYLGTVGGTEAALAFGALPEVMWRPDVGLWLCIAGAAVAWGATSVIFVAAMRSARDGAGA